MNIRLRPSRRRALMCAGLLLSPAILLAESLDLSATVQTVGPDNLALHLSLEDFAPAPGDQPFHGVVSRSGECAFEGTGRMPAYNSARHTLWPRRLSLAGDRLEADVEIRIEPDRWVPSNRQPRTVRCALSGVIARRDTQQPGDPEDAGDPRAGEFWKVLAVGQDAALVVTGNCVFADWETGAPTNTHFRGSLSCPLRPGFWDVGRWEEGVRLDFDMGRDRVNWNHARLARLPFDPPRDWRTAGGLRLRIRALPPRADAEVSVWLGEADGSWYYAKSAVPLVDATNEAVIAFEDFDEAEWVAPGNHMDEDYTLDRGAISELAVGIVNPLGIGAVSFVIESIETIPPAAAPPPARAHVTGATLSVNDHDTVPVGIFGGFAPDLPPEYRPGCQRNLRTGPGGGPSVPRNEAARISTVTNGQTWIEALRAAAASNAPPSPGRHLWPLLREAQRDIEGWALKPPRDSADAAHRDRGIAAALRAIQSRHDLYDPAAWAGLRLPAPLKSRLAVLKEGRAHLPADRLEAHHDLLSATFPAHFPKRDPRAGTERFMVDCMGDRYQPPTFLVDTHWEDSLSELGRRYAREAAENRYQAHLEFWNEAYLNWAERSRIALRNGYYREDLAREGGPVTVRRESRLSPHSITDWPAFIAALRTGALADSNSPAAAVLAALPPPGRGETSGLADRIRSASPGVALGNADQNRLCEALNSALSLARLPDPQPWLDSGQDPRLADAAHTLAGLQAAARARRSAAEAGLAQLKADKAPGPAIRDAERALREAGVNETERPVALRAGRRLLQAAFPGMLADDPADTPEVIPHLEWRRHRREDRKTGATIEEWRVVDPTAFSYWSGLGIGHMFDRMLTALGRAAKSENPDTQIVAGWGFRWHEDHWAAWDLLYRPTIDHNIAWLDGVSEHHYQGDTTAMQGSYEVLTAYGATRHNKWLYAYNTETQDLVDAPARGAVDTPAKVEATRTYRIMTYNLRDLLYSVFQTPDKIRSRTVTHAEGDARELCYGLLADLRGRLIETRTDDPNLWCVAAVDGSDPHAPAPQPGHTLVVVLFNDHRESRAVDLTIAAPTGMRLRDGVISHAWRDTLSLDVALRHEIARVGRQGWSGTVTVPGRAAWKVAFPLTGSLTAHQQVRRRQFFAPDLLQAVRRDKAFDTRVALDPAVLQRAAGAVLRLVVEDIAAGEAWVRVGTHEIALPPARTRDNGNRIVELPVPLAALTPDTPLAFRVADGNHAGYRIDMASIVLETRVP